jgi:hypothetical protein
MDDEWYDGYDGGMYSGSGTKGLKRKTRIPRFKSIIRKGYRGKRSRRGKVSDPETTIVIWVVITTIVSALWHAEWIFASLYALFVLYTLLTKDVWPIRFVSVILTAMGILFFVALGLAVLLNLMVDNNILQDPATQIAYGYIIKVPLLSWSIIWLLENWMVWINKRKFAKANFVEKDKLPLQKLSKLCLTASMVLLIFSAVHFIYTVYSWGFWGLKMFSIIDSWTTPLIIGITMLGKFLQRLANK